MPYKFLFTLALIVYSGIAKAGSSELINVEPLRCDVQFIYKKDSMTTETVITVLYQSKIMMVRLGPISSPEGWLTYMCQRMNIEADDGDSEQISMYGHFVAGTTDLRVPKEKWFSPVWIKIGSSKFCTVRDHTDYYTEICKEPAEKLEIHIVPSQKPDSSLMEIPTPKAK